jgi:hypothetical protein
MLPSGRAAVASGGQSRTPAVHSVAFDAACRKWATSRGQTVALAGRSDGSIVALCDSCYCYESAVHPPAHGALSL